MNNTGRRFSEEHLSYILELVLVQSEKLNEVSERRGFDLHDFGGFVADVYESHVMKEAWQKDDGTKYSYLSDLFHDNEVIEEAIKEVEKGYDGE